MNEFWHPVIRPLLMSARARRIIEIGAGEGLTSTNLARWCRIQGIVAEIVDPAPNFDVATFEAANTDSIRFHRLPSLDILADLLPADIVLVDGDHNWYTVYNEMVVMYGPPGSPILADAPITICHDIGWPYGRRDLYYEPSRIPEEFKHPWRQDGVHPLRHGLTPKGISAHFRHATIEGGPRNGVRTGIEDAIGDRRSEFWTVTIDVFAGLAINVPRQRLTDNAPLEAFLHNLEFSRVQRDLLRVIEQRRILEIIAPNDAREPPDSD